MPFDTVTKTLPPRTTITTRASALAAIRGQRGKIPDLVSMMEKEGWLAKQHPRVDDVRKEVNDLLQSMCDSETELQGLWDADIGGWAAWWAPDAEFEKLCWVAYYLVWLFLWDDRYEAVMISGAMSAAHAHFEAALAYIPATIIGETMPPNSDDMLMQFWKTRVAWPLQDMCDLPHRQLLANEIREYFVALQEEFRIVSMEGLPSIEEYLHYRIGMISVKFLVVATEFISGTYLPASILGLTAPAPQSQQWKLHFAHPESETFLEHIIIVNGILSGYKEVLAGDVSLLTLLDSHYGSLQQATDTAVEGVRKATHHVEGAAKRLKEREGVDAEMVERYASALKMCCAGNVMWSLGTKRYRLAPFRKADGTLEVGF